jgi:hypothetical protein
MLPLEDRLLFAAGAGVVLNPLGERGSGKDSKGIAVRFLNHREFNLGMNKITIAIRALQHPVRHWTSLKQKHFPTCTLKCNTQLQVGEFGTGRPSAWSFLRFFNVLD